MAHYINLFKLPIAKVENVVFPTLAPTGRTRRHWFFQILYTMVSFGKLEYQLGFVLFSFLDIIIDQLAEELF